MAEDIYMNYLKKYYEEHGNINDIMPGDVVEIDGRIINIYEFLKKIKYNHKKYISGKTDRGVASKLSLARYEQLDKMGYDWSVHPSRRNKNPYTDKEILYLRKHFEERGTINDIGTHDVVQYEGEEVKIGHFLMAMRARHNFFLQGNPKNQSMSKLSRTRYEILEEMKIDWTPKWSNTYDVLNNDICLEYLQYHYEMYGTINDIVGDYIVAYKDQTLKIGDFIVITRRRHKDYESGKGTYDCCNELFLKRYELFDKMGFIWNPQKEKQENDIYLEYLKEYYKEHSTINDIISSQEVAYKGQKLRIGGFLARMRTQYNQYLANPNNREVATDLLLNRYHELNKLGFNWTLATRNGIAEFARKNNFDIKQISVYTSKFKGNAQKAFKIRLLQEKLKQQKPDNRYKNCQLDIILDHFKININQLINYLNRDNLRKSKDNPNIIYTPNMTLIEFCEKNNYNYKIIARAVCLKLDNLCDESFESLLNRCLINYKSEKHTKPSTWIYSKYGNEKLVKQMINGTGIPSPDVLIEMTNECIGLEQAFANVIFRKNRGKHPYTKGIFHELVNHYEQRNSQGINKEIISQELEKQITYLIEEYDLTESELAVIKKAFNEYKTAIHQYRIFDVAFEKDNKRKHKKMLEYNFDEEDIKKAFFAPLQFDGKKLIGRDHELYNRRQLLITLGLTWGSTISTERSKKVAEHNLSETEIYFLDNAIKGIKHAKILVLQK